MGHGAGGHGVEDVVGPRQGQRQSAQVPAPVGQAEAVAQAPRFQVRGPEVGPGIQAVSDELAGMVAQHRFKVRVVGPGNDPGPGRQFPEIGGKGLLDVGQIPVVVQVLPVQVGDHGGLGA